MTTRINDPAQASDQGGYTHDQVTHFRDEVRRLRNVQPSLQIDLSHLAGQLTVERARQFANEAMGRRLPVIEQTVLNIFDLYPPDRSDFLSKSECTNVAIQLHAFAINVSAFFDNAAWVCVLQGGGDLAPAQVGPSKKTCQPFMPPDLVDYLAQERITHWFSEYGKVYRDATAHRIPPYLPDRTLTTEEAARMQALQTASMEQLLSWNYGESHEQVTERLAKQAELDAEKNSLGRNSLMIALTLTGDDATHPVYLHPQLLCDWALIQEFVHVFTHAMRMHYELEFPTIPPMTVC